MRARISAIPTIYGIGCAGMGCGGLGDDSVDVTGMTDQQAIDAADQWIAGFDSAQQTYTGTPTNTTNGTTTIPTASVISGLTNAFTSIFKAIQPLPSGCTQVAGPYGMSTQCTPSGSTALSLGSSLTSGGSSSLLLIGGAVLLAVMMFSKK